MTTIKEIAQESGLTDYIVRRDIRLGYLQAIFVEGIRQKHYLLSPDLILSWLYDRRTRVGGLTLESKDWQARLNSTKATAA